MASSKPIMTEIKMALTDKASVIPTPLSKNSMLFSPLGKAGLKTYQPQV